MKHPERTEDYLGHMVVACNRISQAVAGKQKADFVNDLIAQDSVLRQITVLGEVGKLLRENNPGYIQSAGLAEIFNVIGMRNRIVHEYLNVDVELVWEVATVDAPCLRLSVLRLLLSKVPDFDADSLNF